MFARALFSTYQSFSCLPLIKYFIAWHCVWCVCDVVVALSRYSSSWTTPSENSGRQVWWRQQHKWWERWWRWWWWWRRRLRQRLRRQRKFCFPGTCYTKIVFRQIFKYVHICYLRASHAGETSIICSDVCPSVCLSVCLSAEKLKNW